MTTGVTNAMGRRIQHEEMKRRAREALLDGITSSRDIAVRLGISPDRASVLLRQVRDEMVNDPIAKAEIDEKRSLRVAQLESVYQKAINSFKKSSQDQEDFTVEVKPCPNCKGIRTEKDDFGNESKCKVCGGKGTVSAEKVTVKKRIGDPAFLSIAKDVIKVISAIEGSTKEVPGARVSIVNQAVQVGGDVEDAVRSLYTNAEPELLMQAMVAIESIESQLEQQRKKKGSVLVIEERKSSE